MMFSLGAHVGQQNMTMAEMRALWRRLDEAGLDWISAWDHLYEAPPADGTVAHFEAIATLGALCADTSRARIGCLVFYVGYRNPGLLAKAAITLDHISGGRFELGLGAGWHEQEARAFGYDFPDLGTRFDMLEEAAPLIRRLLDADEARTTFAGTHFRTERAACVPGPFNDRHLPIWIGGVGPKRTPRAAARHADGWNAAYISPEQFAAQNAALDRACEAEGRDPATLERTVNLQFALAMTPEGARSNEARIRDQWGEAAGRILAGSLAGTPAQAIDRIAAYRAAGADGLNIALRAPWDGEALDAYLEVVVPSARNEIP